ncbi:D-isomer specific 2-hydroxyacid dehydrogenase family protein [soil metagenome]
MPADSNPPADGPTDDSTGNPADRPTPPRIAVGPDWAPEVFPWMITALEAGGAQIVPVEQAEALLWADTQPGERLPEILARHGEQLRWIQLPWAGTEHYGEVLDTGRVWTSAKGVYSDGCAEMALTLALAGFRAVGSYARATTWHKLPEVTRTLFGSRVVVLGGGGIAEACVKLIAPFDTHVTVVRRTAEPMEGVDRVVTTDQLDEVLPGADLVVLALALTPETECILDARRLALLGTQSWVVNVARGGHIVTDDLVDALTRGVIGGAGLDVTDPEPLPDDHPLWSLPNCIITPHEANNTDLAVVPLSARLVANVQRFAAGQDLIGVVDPAEGY